MWLVKNICLLNNLKQKIHVVQKKISALIINYERFRRSNKNLNRNNYYQFLRYKCNHVVTTQDICQYLTTGTSTVVTPNIFPLSFFFDMWTVSKCSFLNVSSCFVIQGVDVVWMKVRYFFSNAYLSNYSLTLLLIYTFIYFPFLGFFFWTRFCQPSSFCAHLFFLIFCFISFAWIDLFYVYFLLIWYLLLTFIFLIFCYNWFVFRVLFYAHFTTFCIISSIYLI